MCDGARRARCVRCRCAVHRKGHLNEIARVRAQHGDADAFRRMQAQAMVVGQRRIELSMRIAQLEGPVLRN